MTKWTAAALFLTSLVAMPILADEPARATASYSSFNARSELHRHSNRAENRVGFTFGPSIGSVNYSSNDGLIPSNRSTRTRMAFGAFYEHRFTRYLTVRPELNYVQRGYTESFGQGQGSLERDWAVDFVEIPVFAKGQYQVGIATPFLMTGPYVGWAVAKGGTDFQNGQGADFGIDGLVNSFTWGWGFGAGSSFAVARRVNLEASLRYSLSMTNVDATAAQGTSIKLNAFQFLTGMSFAL